MNQTMRLLLIAGTVAYLALAFPVAGGVLWLTLWAYTADGEPLADTVSAAVLNTTAATLVWVAFFGGLDMFFTIWQMMQNREDAARRDKEREEERQARAREMEEQRKFQQDILSQLAAEREESRRQRDDDRREREQFFATLLQAERERALAEKERTDVLMTRILDLAERLENRGNGAHNEQ